MVSRASPESGKIKVLQVNKLYPPVIGGVEKITRQVAEGLRERADMRVLVCRTKGRTLREQVNGVDVYQAGSIGVAYSVPLSLSFFFLFRKLTKDRDILHIHMPFPLADLALCFFRFHGKVALWWHSDIVRQKKWLALYRPLMKRTLERAEVIITATQGHIESSEFLSAYREKCVVIPYGASESLLEAGAKACEAQGCQGSQGCRERLAESQAEQPPVTAQDATKDTTRDTIVFLFVGRLVYYKGCEVLLDAFAKIRRGHLIIVGDGPLERELKDQARRLRVSGQVDFRGYLPDEAVARAFRDCDIFVLPSVARTEAFGIVQLEAMAYGKPVINTRLPSGVPYVSLDGVTGLTVTPGDAAALADAMEKLANDPALRRRLGQAAYRRVREEYRADLMLDRVYGEYRRICQFAPG
jgi:rhamnosyl/mannosyltransferase